MFLTITEKSLPGERTKVPEDCRPYVSIVFTFSYLLIDLESTGRPSLWTVPLRTGGAEGIRTLDLLDAIEARSQLRHGPTG